MLGAIVLAVPMHTCPLRTLTGVPCPTCGLTRAARLLLHGDLAGATRIHPLWFVILPTLAAGVVLELRGVARDGRFGAAAESRPARRIGAAVLGLAVAVWIARFFGAFGGPALG